MRTILKACLSLIVVVGVTAPTLSEVRVKTDRRGEYETTQVITGSRNTSARIWTVFGKGRGSRFALNPHGDRLDDLWPAIAENSLAPYHPWVVWSRHNGNDYDLVWSRWEQSTWKAVDWIHPETPPGDDLDANLAFDSTGRPYVVWWTVGPDGGQVYLSLFLATQWATAYGVSADGVDARYPVVHVGEDGEIHVEYETDEGTVSQLVLFEQPDTITDDIDPLDRLRLEGDPVVIRDNRR